jgi:O-antigen biosynthesis protein
VVVDNASQDGTVEAIRSRFHDVEVIVNEKNLGYAAAVNRGVRSCNAAYYIISNSDVIYPEGAVDLIVRALKEHPEYGVMGTQQLYADGRWQRSYDNVQGYVSSLKNITFARQLSYFFKSRLWKKFNLDNKVKDVGYIDGAMLAFRREIYDAVGGWDEDYFFYTEEADFCYRLHKMGHRVVFNPDIRITHLRGGTTKDISVSRQFIKILLESKGTFFRKHYSKTKSRIIIYLEILFCAELLIINSGMFLLTFFGEKYRHKIAAMKDFIREWKNELKKI